MIQAKLRLRWSAEICLERALAVGLADELSEAGCVALAFGYESGSQRILSLINKGVNLEAVPGMLIELKRVGIGAQMMGFIGFPGETSEDAHATFEFLLENSTFWTLAGIGDFVLTQGAIVAKRYEEFGIQWIGAMSGQDIVRSLCWIDGEGRRRGMGESRSDSISEISGTISRFPFTRPFVGGIDSTHTILYFAKYGAALVPSTLLDTGCSTPLTHPVLYATPFEVLDSFTTANDIIAFRRERLLGDIPTSFRDVCDWLAGARERDLILPEESGSLIEILSGGEFLTIGNQEADFLRNGGSAYKKVRDLLLCGYGFA
jgi:hypothetical protein